MNGPERRIPKRWTEAEDEILYHEARSQRQVKDWNRIAAKLPGRTNKDCRKRWINKVCGSLKKGAWSEDEDARLREAIRAHGQKWTVIANIVGLRSPDQCAKRWQYCLDPRLDHGRWEPAEDERLMNMVQIHGREWKFIQEREFPTRSRNELKNRYTTLSRKLDSTDKTTTTNSPSSGCSSAGEAQALDTENGPGMVEADAEDEVQVDNDGAEHLQWGDARMDQSMPVEMWVDSVGGARGESLTGSWLDHLADPAISNSPTPGLYSASGDPSSSEATLAPERDELQGDPMALVGHTLELGDEGFQPLLDARTTSDLLTPSLYRASRRTPGLEDKGFQSLTGPCLAASGDPVGRVSLVVDQCDREALNYLLDVSRELKGRVKLEIDM
ncbi:hypothetical protein DL767_011260 [Monosporascus sp. MG133]|nr:hypothetical protein DL767_011260 [Monosporascus sp. MG133]